jgi:two-component system sensor histidine kinase RegB
MRQIVAAEKLEQPSRGIIATVNRTRGIAMKPRFHYRPIEVLRLLFWLRNCAIFCQLLVIAAAGLDRLLPLVAVLAIWNTVTFIRLCSERPVAYSEVSLHLLIDIATLGALLYFTGGSTNPFVSLLLVPIAIAAAALPLIHASVIALVCAATYTLLFTNTPGAVHHGEDFQLHLQGMWVNFLVSAVVMTVFLSALAQVVRRQNEMLSAAREEALRNEHIIGLGTLAAGTAHAINTPLSTIAVLVSELREQYADERQLSADWELLADQLSTVKSKLTELLRGAERNRTGSKIAIKTFIGESVDHLRLLRPEININISYAESFDNQSILATQTLEQALLNLLNNAADASMENGSKSVELECRTGNDRLELRIIDHGLGFPTKYQSQAGKEMFTTKGSGLGIGLVLSNASINMHGGEVTIRPLESGGTETQILLPTERRNANAA